MRIKYYLKGLGIGMIVATLLMGIATKDSSAMTDEEIKAKAKELGMVEQKTLSDVVADITPEPSNVPKEEAEPIATKTPAPTEVPSATAVPDVTASPIPTEEPLEPPVIEEEEQEAEDENTTPETELIELEIRSGDSSDSVCMRLKEFGVIEDSVAFNRYLCNNGYDRKLNIGSYKLKKGMSDEEIAKIITRTR